MRISSILLVLLLILGMPAGAQTTTGSACRWGDIPFPRCEASFADEVVSVKLDGLEITGDHNAILDHPDNKRLRLGCEGIVIVRFTDNALVDIPGDDLHVFERGDDPEPTRLEITDNIADHDSWVDIGEIPGATASIDIEEFVHSEQTFTHIRLTDLGSACGPKFPGAEIDAVGAIGAAIREKFDSDVLFDYDSAALSPAGAGVLDVFAQSYDSGEISRIIINGHASSEGSKRYNLDLSSRRAAAVRVYLSDRPEFEDTRILSAGLGESQANQQAVREEDRHADVWLVKSNP